MLKNYVKLAVEKLSTGIATISVRVGVGRTPVFVQNVEEETRPVRHGNRSYVTQCLSTAGPQPDTRPRHQLYRAARGSPGICHFSFLSNFHE